MASQSARLRTDGEIARLKGDLERMAGALDDPDEFDRADAAFHLTVMASSRNRLAESVTKILFERARESSRFRGNDHKGPAELALTLTEHARVYEAIEAGNGDLAERAMRQHIADAWARRRPAGVDAR
jgi:GntR family transcriptional regulator, galactonate operon transcriptional repressor